MASEHCAPVQVNEIRGSIPARANYTDKVCPLLL